ncbi:MAG: sigma-70 family RNA polymerase sigma factor [Planctomycetota bacterium]
METLLAGECAPTQEIDIESARQGNQEALGRLLSSIEALMLTVATQTLTKDVRVRVSAEDVVQNACFDIAKNIGTFRGKTMREFVGWANLLTSHRAVESVRRNNRQKRSVKTTVFMDTTPSLQSKNATAPRIAEFRDELNRVMIAMQKLPPSQCEALRLVAIEGLSQREAAERMDRGVDSVHSLVWRARRRLKEIMQEAS